MQAVTIAACVLQAVVACSPVDSARKPATLS
jgi:hypothetical protein